MGALAVVPLIAFILLSSPDNLAINKSGEIQGMINQARESIQGDAFWADQASKLQRELKDLRAEPKRHRAMEKEIRELEKEQEQWDREFYSEFPEARPSPAERKAQALRDKADAIEQAEFQRFMEESRVERIRELKLIKAKIRLHIQ